MVLRAKSAVFLSCDVEVCSCVCWVVVIAAGAAIQIAGGSAAVGVEQIPCWYDSACN
jgi:hypothetical protein